MEENFIEHRNFLQIYIYNKLYKKEHRRHKRALYFQLLLLILCIILATINYYLEPSFIYNLYLDQINRIYALLVALLTAILIGITPLDRDGRLNKRQHNYLDITYKQDYVSIIMYTLLLYVIGILISIIYAMFLQFLSNYIVTFIFWVIHLFVLLNSLFFTIYCVDELADIIKYIK